MENFIKEECCICGVLFAVSANLIKNWRNTKKTFYCPNGHSQSYTKSTTDILQEKLDMQDRIIINKNIEIVNMQYELKKLNRKLKRKK